MDGEHVESLDALPSRPRRRDELNRWLPRINLPSLHLRASERKLLLFVVDLLIINGALLVAMAWLTDWLEQPGALLFALGNLKWFLTLSLYWCIAAVLADSYDLARAASAPYSVLNAGATMAAVSLIYLLTPVFSPPLTSRGLFFAFAALSVGGVSLWRAGYAVLFVQPSFQQRALVLGAGQAGCALAELLKPIEDSGNPFRGTGYRIIGFVDDDAAKRGQEVAGIPVLGDSRALCDLAETLRVDEIVLAITDRQKMTQEAFDALLTCRERGFRVTTMPTLYERLLGRVPVHHIGRNLHAVLPEESGPTERLYGIAKRFGDLIMGSIGLLALGLVTPVVALANALFSPGPLFYRQARVGQGGRPFQVHKFRTMIPDAERDTGAVWSQDNDPRITPVGKWLRRTRLDELPQVINVLYGQMSMIGPRPERPEITADLAAQVPFYRARHAVKPGLTGWAQVRFGYGNTVEDARIKLEYDLYYVRHAGFYLDALILLKTVSTVLQLQGQ
jgi:exopolysaccharide biosynthesis polyprenyl glycosylphosphotransferase